MGIVVNSYHVVEIAFLPQVDRKDLTPYLFDLSLSLSLSQ